MRVCSSSIWRRTRSSRFRLRMLSRSSMATINLGFAGAGNGGFWCEDFPAISCIEWTWDIVVVDCCINWARASCILSNWGVLSGRRIATCSFEESKLWPAGGRSSSFMCCFTGCFVSSSPSCFNRVTSAAAFLLLVSSSSRRRFSLEAHLYLGVTGSMTIVQPATLRRLYLLDIEYAVPLLGEVFAGTVMNSKSKIETHHFFLSFSLLKQSSLFVDSIIFWASERLTHNTFFVFVFAKSKDKGTSISHFVELET